MVSMTIDDHDRGLRHDLWVLSRRRAIFALSLGAAAVAGCGTTQASGTSPKQAAPQETQGPYPGDGSNGPNVLIESGVVRSDITTSFGTYSGAAEGVPATLDLNLQDLAKDGAAGAGMAVYVWHCDREGRYSLYSEGLATYAKGDEFDHTSAEGFIYVWGLPLRTVASAHKDKMKVVDAKVEKAKPSPAKKKK